VELVEQGNKTERVLGIYSKLCDGLIINKVEEAERYLVNERTIQRDIDDIREFLDKSSISTGFINSVVYDYSERGYRLEKVSRMKLSNSEVLGICKILLDSRAFTKDEMMPMIDKLLQCCVPKNNQKIVFELIANEKYHYVELNHRIPFVDRLWDIGTAIKESRYMNVKYIKIRDKSIVTRKLKPVGIIFSEFYFYMIAYIEDIDKMTEFSNQFDEYPTIYRIDRIKEYEILDEHYKIPYSDRFEEGEFRKRVQFMYGGKLKIIKFKFTGYDIDSILDRLPTAKIISKDDSGWVVQAEVFGDGIDMWLRSQAEVVKVLE
jgi:predicted DNA-binding transcriptional regulator YafY